MSYKQGVQDGPPHHPAVHRAQCSRWSGPGLHMTFIHCLSSGWETFVAPLLHLHPFAQSRNSEAHWSLGGWGWSLSAWRCLKISAFRPSDVCRQDGAAADCGCGGAPAPTARTGCGGSNAFPLHSSAVQRLHLR